MNIYKLNVFPVAVHFRKITIIKNIIIFPLSGKVHWKLVHEVVAQDNLVSKTNRRRHRLQLTINTGPLWSGSIFSHFRFQRLKSISFKICSIESGTENELNRLHPKVFRLLKLSFYESKVCLRFDTVHCSPYPFHIAFLFSSSYWPVHCAHRILVIFVWLQQNHFTRTIVHCICMWLMLFWCLVKSYVLF